MHVSPRVVIACVCFLACGNTAVAAPYVPASDAVVLERLPYKPNDPIARQMATMRAALKRNPQDLEVATGLARRYYELVAEEGDPRFLGYAQAALAPWWNMQVPPLEVQILRASLAQFRHDFAGALADLGIALERDPQNSRARTLRAVIHLVQARYEPARADCQAMRGSGGELLAVGCEAMVNGLTGNAKTAYLALNEALVRHPDATKAERLWVLTRLAEISQRLGQTEAAEKHFKQALALDIADTFLLAAYADFLLDQQRPKEVIALLKDKTRSDVLLLRLVLAERTLNLPNAKQSEASLAARYAAAQLRGDTVHQQEEARFALTVVGDQRKALELAKENWKVQLEPRDARIFLEAALAMRDPGAAQPVLKWLDESRIEDPHLIGLGRQLKGIAK